MGDLVAGAVGHSSLDYTIIGAQVNLAARLEQAGEPDGIMLSYETYRQVNEEFSCEESLAIKAKGIAREIRCFSLKGNSACRRRAEYFHQGAQRHAAVAQF